MSSFRKDADARIDYKLDWTQWLNGDDIVSAYAFIDSPGTAAVSAVKIAASYVSANQEVHVIWLSAGVELTEYQITSRVWTSAGRRDDESFFVVINQE